MWHYMRFFFLNWSDKDEADCRKYWNYVAPIIVYLFMVVVGAILVAAVLKK